jgi:hypothetical protein
MHTRNGILLATLGIIALAPGLVLAKGKHAAAAPSATVRLEAKQVAAGVGWAWGDGVLNYRGKQHRFKLSGLTAVGVGASRQDATGEVYNLKKLDDFEGTYTSVEASGAVGGGAGIATMRSVKGVRITLHAASQGVAAQAGPEGIKITLDH